MLFLILPLAVGVFFVVANYLGIFKTKDYSLTQKDTPIASQNRNRIVDYEIQEVARDLYVPWSIAFTSENRILVTERNGQLREIKDGKLNPLPLMVFEEVSATGEEGLMGLTVDPDYAKNGQIYVSYAYADNEGMFVKVVRLKDFGDRVKEDKVIIDKIPAATYHAGNRLKFGPDKKLYITTGDGSKKELAQELGSLAGKILRLNNDGSIPGDNPYPNSPVYSLGHRNPQGLAWNIKGDVLFSTEHGPSLIDGPAGGDEINIIEKALNYGWPILSHEKRKEGYIHPIALFTPAVAPSSAMIYSGKLFPQYEGDLFFGGLKGEGLFRADISNYDPKLILATEKLGDVDFGRIREVAESPSGEIYFSTSNRDGRGKVNGGDDRIYKLVQKL